MTGCGWRLRSCSLISSKAAGESAPVQIRFRERRAVAYKKDALAEGTQLLGELLQRDRPIGAETEGTAVLDTEEGVVYLRAPRVHDRADHTAGGQTVPGHGLERRNANTGFFRAPAQALDRGHADADAGEGAGAVRHSDRVDVRERQRGVLQKILGHRQKGAAVRQRADLQALRQQLPVPHERGGGGPGGGFKGKDQHGAPSPIVMRRSFSPSFSIRTGISSPKKASDTFSLHSTAQTAPRAR